MVRFRALVRQVWRLTKGYWGAEERWFASGMLATIIGLNLGLVYVNVLLNTANGTIFNALQQQDSGAFYSAFVEIVALILLYLAVALLRFFLNQTLQLRWRRWLTRQYLGRWITNGVFYRMRFAGRVDNPDQRIADDIRMFIEQTMGLGLGLLNAAATLGSFAIILWNLSGSVTIPIGGMEFVIPGYMFWVAVVYSGFGSVLAHLIGRPLIRLGNRQQAVEADFRFGLVRVREEAEGIALYHGEDQERQGTLERFRALYENFRRLIHRNVIYLTYQLFLGQFANFFPLLVAAPRYFSGAIQLGGLMQTANAFGQVNDSLSWFINSYQTFADWRATVDRLTEFSEELTREAAVVTPGATVVPATDGKLRVENVAIALPNGLPLISTVDIAVRPGERVLIKGASGSGKSTVFRVLAGLWPFAEGRIRLPAGARALFLPQRPYLPIGTLRRALWFPMPADPARDDEVRAALEAVDLTALASRLGETAHWAQVLSGGEQQRVALARAHLIRPDWLFLDEATAATDEVQEASLYRRLFAALPGTAVVSIGHRRTLEPLHDRVLMIERTPGQPGRLVPLAV